MTDPSNRRGAEPAKMPRKLYDPELELSLIGAINTSDRCREQVEPILRPDDFWHEDHARLFEAIMRAGDGECYAEPRLSGLMSKALDVCGLALMNPIPVARRIADLASRRRWVAAGQQLVQAVYNGGDAEAIMREALAQEALRIRGKSTWVKLDGVMTEITWCWPGWLPNGFLTILAGEQESGKSVLALRVAATILTAAPWPDGRQVPDGLRTVVWCEAESSQVLNWQRAKSWGLPLDRIGSPLSDPFEDFRLDNPDHMQALERAARDPSACLVVLDSLSGAHARKENDVEMLWAIKRLAELARNVDKPVLLTHHLRKHGIFDSDDKISLDRVRGSGAITQMARSVWAVDTPDAGQPDVRRLSVLKCNLSGKRPQPLGFTIHDKGVTFVAAPEVHKEETQVDRAIDLLLTLLDAGPVPCTVLQEEAKGMAISDRTLRRAKEKLGVSVHRKDDRWVWALPAKKDRLN